MHIGSYNFSCKFSSPAILPSFKGSTLRGALGHSIKKISCALRRQNCQNCLLTNSCAYSYLYEIKNANNQNQPARAAHRPHPYALIPPTETKQTYKSGDNFNFDLLLFGSANEYLPHVVYAIQEMGKSGLGKKNQEPGQFNLEKITHEQKVIFENNHLQAPQTLPLLSLEETSPANSIKTITVTCKTPLRLKQLNKLQHNLPFHLLIRGAMRRCSTLENAYGNGEPKLDYKGLAGRAGDVEITQADSHWVDIRRYSNRQKNSMLFGGIKGQITYQGKNLTEFIPLLKFSEVTQLGKQTTFGLGQIKIEAHE